MVEVYPGIEHRRYVASWAVLASLVSVLAEHPAWSP